MYIYFGIIFILICYLFTFISRNDNTSNVDLQESDYYTAYNNEQLSIL